MIRKQSSLPSERFVFEFIMAVSFYALLFANAFSSCIVAKQ